MLIFDQKRKELMACLNEIREACAVATSMDDVSMNAVIEEIDRLAKSILDILEQELFTEEDSLTMAQPTSQG